MKTFNLPKEGYTIDCTSERTRSGFRHVAILRKNGLEHDRTKICYQNRTWESFEFESVLFRLIEKTGVLNIAETKEYREMLNAEEHERVNAMFGSLRAVCALGDVLTKDKKESNEWKKRIMKASLGERVSFPDDWDSLSEDEKQKRLDNAVGVRI